MVGSARTTKDVGIRITALVTTTIHGEQLKAGRREGARGTERRRRRQ